MTQISIFSSNRRNVHPVQRSAQRHGPIVRAEERPQHLRTRTPYAQSNLRNALSRFVTFHPSHCRQNYNGLSYRKIYLQGVCQAQRAACLINTSLDNTNSACYLYEKYMIDWWLN